MVTRFSNIKNNVNPQRLPQYVNTIGETNMSHPERWAASLTGAALLVYGSYSLVRQSWAGLGLVVSGSYLLGTGLTGHNPLYKAAGVNRAEDSSLPSTAEKVKSRLDEAIQETFPASDPLSLSSERDKEREASMAS